MRAVSPAFARGCGGQAHWAPEELWNRPAGDCRRSRTVHIRLIGRIIEEENAYCPPRLAALSCHDGSFLAASDARPTEYKPSVREKGSKAQKAAADGDLPAVLWRDPGDISSLDVAGGPGGKEHAPAANDGYKFIREDLNATSTKFYVEDSHGVRWLVKVAEEAKPETAATRIRVGHGIFCGRRLLPAANSCLGDAATHARRFGDCAGRDRDRRQAETRETTPEDKVANWSWTDNPFVGTRELNGLRVMMALLNNWDLTTANNKVYVANDTERRFVVSDMGASFGKTGGLPRGPREC